MNKFTKAIKPVLSVLMVVAVILLSAPVTLTSAAGPWYVKEGGNDSLSCLSPAAACGTLNGVISKASPGDIIRVAIGTYTGSGTEVVHVAKNLIFSGGWNADFSDTTGLSTIDAESARRGVVIQGSTVSMSRFIIENGVYNDAAGILATGQLTLNRTIVRNNTNNGDWTSEGGGIRTITNLSIYNSTIQNNLSPSGAGIFNTFGTLTIVNSTISGNVATGGGGGINNLGGNVITNNVTITGNQDSAAGGGIHNEGGGTVTLKNTILAGNSSNFANDCNGTIGTAGYNLIGDTSNCGFTPATGDLVNISAQLDDLKDNGGPTPTHALMSSSPAIDAGNPLLGSCDCIDQRGTSRPVDGDQDGTATCDIGAFEYVPPTFPDVPWEHWAVDYVEAIYNAGLTSGYPDGTYRPENQVTRAEMAVFLINAMGITPSTPDGSHPFSDIAGHWAEAFIEELYDQGVTGGYPDGTYRPENLVTRAEMAVFLLNSLGFSPDPINGSHPFSDIAGHWAEAFIEELFDRGITGGYPDGTYRPENLVTRAEMAVFLVNAFTIPLP